MLELYIIKIEIQIKKPRKSHRKTEKVIMGQNWKQKYWIRKNKSDKKRQKV